MLRASTIVARQLRPPLWPVGTTGPTNGLRLSVSLLHDLFSLYILLSVL